MPSCKPQRRDQSRDETGNFRDRCNLLAREPSYAHHESDEKTKNSAWQEPADETSPCQKLNNAQQSSGRHLDFLQTRLRQSLVEIKHT